ncbi:MAG: DUF389 domain-containing protein [Bacteroidales bacterium]|jgi:uncharacterized hydrophobic protein (TIGR00271 family)|nr:DUF389 domain-containing protein [Bacteroidales bacterium]
MVPKDLMHKFLNYINLESEVDDFTKTHAIIEKDLVFKGTNLWILVFAIIVASVGLNMNSTAVIIGAMLISPLMGPINGMGYSIATYNFPLFRKAIKNFTFAVVASLLASTAYFAMSPISTAHSELLARTSPTIYDVLIALFGGLAGIVAISSKQKGNVIPGVAIATALMPPLCTAGYGLATGQFEYFFGAIYLFTINTVFIAISAVVVCQVLKFPIITLVDNAQKKRVNRWISVVISLVLIPSIYFGYNLVQKERFNENASKYINNIGYMQGNLLLKHEINPNTKTITLVYGGTRLTEPQKEEIRRRSSDFSLKEAEIEFQQGLSFDEFAARTSEVDKLKLEISHLSDLLKEKELQIDSLNSSHFMGKVLLDEIRTLYPGIVGCYYANSYQYTETDQVREWIRVIVFKTNGKFPGTSDREKISNWLRMRLGTDNVKVFYEN